MIKKIIIISLLFSTIAFFVFSKKAAIDKQNITNIIHVENPQKNTGTKVKSKPTNDENFKTPTIPPVEETSQQDEYARDSDSDSDKQDQENVKKIQEVIQIINQHKYSKDSLVEFLSVLGEVESCEKSESTLNNISDKEIRTFLEESLKIQCKDYKNTKRLLSNFNNPKKVMPLFSTQTMQSKNTEKFALFIKQKNKKEGMEFLFKLALTSKSSQMIIIQADRLVVTSYLQAIANQLAIQNHDYIQLIGKQALQIFSCQYQAGITCTATSAFMLNHCEYDKILCGKDSYYWFNHYISEAHKADLEIIMNWLNQQT